MNYLPRLLGLGLLTLLVAMLMMSCESTKPGAGEFGTPTRVSEEAMKGPESREIVQLTNGKPEFITPQSDLAAAFIRQFSDGTVIDKIMVHKAPADAGDKGPASYYLVGMGLNNGSFRAMALPLVGSGGGSYYLSPNAERYVITSTGCPRCFFNFENGRIVGTTCAEASSGTTCDLKVESANDLLSRR